MPAFVYCHDRHDAAESGLDRSRLEHGGFQFDGRVKTRHGCFYYAAAPERCSHFLAPDGQGFAFLSGMLFYKGETAAAALRLLYDDFDRPASVMAAAKGQFTIALYKKESLHLLSDPLGINKIYHDQDSSLFSNRFIAVARLVRSPRADVQGCYEYAWNGVPFGRKTFVEEIKSVPPGHAVSCRESVALEAVPPPDLGEEAPDDEEELLRRHLGRLRDLTQLYVRHFGSRFRVSLSGGYDSRLLLILLLEAGARPHLFVYGRKDDLECRLARAIAEGEKLDFEQVDKSSPPRIAVSNYAAHLEGNVELFDGWKIDGLFDDGADAPDRFARVRDGMVKVNGSVGEIYRNFFYLPDRSYAVRELVWTFYSQYDPSACTRAFDPRGYEAAVAREIKDALALKGDRLARREVELAYPLFRARFWTAREVPINQGFGPCLFPFMEPDLIKGTCDIAIALKSHGLFEGRLMRRLNPRVAAYPSVYGHSFAEDPPLSHRLKAQLSYRRPPFLRRYAYRIRQRRKEPPPYFLERDYLRAVIDPDFPLMRRLFNVDRINDPDVLNRVATMEYILERINAADTKER